MVEVRSNGNQVRVVDGECCLGTFTREAAQVFRREGGVALSESPPSWENWQAAMVEVHGVGVAERVRPAWAQG